MSSSIASAPSRQAKSHASPSGAVRYISLSCAGACRLPDGCGNGRQRSRRRHFPDRCHPPAAGVATADQPPAIENSDVALVDQAEGRKVAVVTRFDLLDASRLVLSLDYDARGAADHDRAEEPRLRKAAGGRVVDGDCGMRGGRARHLPKSFAGEFRRAGVDDEAVPAGGHLEGEAAGMRAARQVDGKRSPGFHDDDGIAHRQTFVMACGKDRNGSPDVSSYLSTEASSWARTDVAPLKRASSPLWWRKKRSAGYIRSMQGMSLEGTSCPRLT